MAVTEVSDANNDDHDDVIQHKMRGRDLNTLCAPAGGAGGHCLYTVKFRATNKINRRCFVGIYHR